ncbi:MAG: hypothetical protein RLZZ92_450, partial [Actinomycetota bacterium]
MELLGLSQLREKIKMKLDQKIIKCRA